MRVVIIKVAVVVAARHADVALVSVVVYLLPAAAAVVVAASPFEPVASAFDIAAAVALTWLQNLQELESSSLGNLLLTYYSYPLN